MRAVSVVQQRTRSGAGAAVAQCEWCGRPLPETTTAGRVGRPRRYCAQACRQRAYEQRTVALRTGLPAGSVVLSQREFGELADRIFQLRCVAEDIVTAAADGADPAELQVLATELAEVAKSVEQIR